MFALTDTPLDGAALRAGLAKAEAGACVCFEGWVRNHNDGRAVTQVEYEAYAAVAEKEGKRILAEARARFAIYDARCVHRTGLLAVGDMAVWIGVTAAHRAPAFDACEFIIDAIKLRLPIWKKEYYTDGDSGWVNCQVSGAPATDRTDELKIDPAS